MTAKTCGFQRSKKTFRKRVHKNNFSHSNNFFQNLKNGRIADKIFYGQLIKFKKKFSTKGIFMEM